jgi:predicted GH43/DUF377 family glycosyl hydrolase
MLSSTKSRIAGNMLIQTLFFFLLITRICFGQYVWTKFEGNPVLSGGPTGSWNTHLKGPYVLFNSDSSRFEMWFTAFSNNGMYCKIGYAESFDGVNWEMRPDPVLSPSVGKWDATTVEFASVIRENGQYRMYYAGNNSGSNFKYKTGLAFSSDGISWIKDTLNSPVVVPGAEWWEEEGIHGVCVMTDGSSYSMWYEGFRFNPTVVGMGYAESIDGVTWQKDTLNNPLFLKGGLGEWDEGGIHMPNVILIDSMYYMYFGGMNTNWGGRKIGMAISHFKNQQWLKYPSNPVLSPSATGWDNNWVEEGRVFLIGDTLWMWYAACNKSELWQIGLAKSPIQPVSVEQETIQPTVFSLEQNFPNPFNPITKIKYSVPQSSQVQIKVFDILGNELETLVNEEKQVGTYELTWNAANLPSGVYFYQLKAGEIVQTKKMLLLK